MANLNSETTVDSVSTTSLCDLSSAIDDEFGRCISATARCCNNWHTSSTCSCSSTNGIPTPTSCGYTKCGPSKGMLFRALDWTNRLVGTHAASYEFEGRSD